MTYRWDDLPEWQQNYARTIIGRASVPDSHLWIDADAWARVLQRPMRRQRVRQWARRRLWFMTRDGRQTRELGRLLEAIDRQARERGQ
jgi:hypothetical protein